MNIRTMQNDVGMAVANKAASVDLLQHHALSHITILAYAVSLTFDC